VGFEYDPRRQAGRIDQIRPGLVAALESLGYQVRATDDELALRLDVLGLGRLPADLRFGDGNGLLTLVMKVSWTPEVDPRLPEALARFNAEEQQLTAVSLPGDDGGEVVQLWVRLAPVLGARDPFLPDTLHGALESMARAKVRLSKQLAGELGAQPLDPPRENNSGRYARPGARSSGSQRLKRPD